MSYGTFWESLLANAALAIGYVGIKLCTRISRSTCNYTRAEGLEIHLPDPEEPVDVAKINQLFENHGLSMRMR